VTVAQWRAFVQASGYVGDSRALRQGKDDHPVNYVSWNDAAAFCVWASEVSGRAVALPSEAQWEKAARGPDGRGYPWGNEPAAARRCNCDRSEGDTTPVGRYSPSGDSPYGCADMSGNVWEWVADWHCFDYYAVSPRSDPQGPSSGRQRAMRGGCWWSFPTDTCAARRSSCGEAGRSEFYGFRIRMASQ
jgi:formylglycine-generating enzyme required for sulfatase activity